MKESLEDYVEVMRSRYGRRAGRRARGALLDEFCETTGFERKCGLKVLRGQRRCTGGSKAAAHREQWDSRDLHG